MPVSKLNKVPRDWDKINATSYRSKSSIDEYVPELRWLHQDRISDNADFNYLKDAFAYRKARSEEDVISLSEARRRQEQADREAFWLALENTKRAAQGLEALASLDDLNEEEEPVLAEASSQVTPGTGAIVPDNADEQGSAPVPGSEMAGASGSPESPLPADLDPEATEEDEPVDPYLVESGHILLDLITLEETTAEKRRAAQGS